MEDEWKQLEEDWMKIAQKRSEDDPYYVRPSKKEESYESESDEYKFEDEDEAEEEPAAEENGDLDNFSMFGSDSEFEYNDEDNQKRQEKKKKNEQRKKMEKRKSKNDRNKKETGFGQKIINIVVDEINVEKEKVVNKSKACSIM